MAHYTHHFGRNKSMARPLSAVALALLTVVSFTGCVFVPAAVHDAQQQPPTTQPVEQVEEAQAQQEAPEPEPMTDEELFIEASMSAFYLPSLTPSMESQLLEVGYLACDMYADGTSRDTIVFVMEQAVADYQDVYTPRAASIITDAALTHLC